MEAAVGYRITCGSRVVTISGDTVAGRGVAALAAGADVLVHQALRSDLVPADALTWNASAGSVGTLAAELGVGHLVLTHLMPIPRGEDDEQAFVTEARAGGYRGPITVARDLGELDVA
jgi:ribonuclease Z